MRYEYRCSTINLEQQNVSLATISKRVSLSFEIPKYYKKFIQWKFKSFELVYIHRRFFIHFVVENPVSQELLNSPHSGVFVGIDRGMRHIAVSSQNQFYSGSRLRESKDKYFRLKRSLQKKGTRSAKTKLKKNYFKYSCKFNDYIRRFKLHTKNKQAKKKNPIQSRI